MRMKWGLLKNLISGLESQDGMFLTLLDEKGDIVCANSRMVRSLQLQNPRKEQINFLDLLHPVNLDHFKKTLQDCTDYGQPVLTELYVKNGHYHPMKWMVKFVQQPLQRNNRMYFCAGYPLKNDNRQEESRKLAEKNYELIVEGLNSGVLFQDKEGELISANPKAAEIFGSTLERLYSIRDVKNLWDSTWDIRGADGEKISFMNTPFMKAIASGKPQSELLAVKILNGDFRWIHFSSQPLFEEGSSNAYAAVTSLVDFTQEKKLSAELQEKEKLFNVFMQHSPHMAWMVEEDGTLVFASKSFYKYFRLNENGSINKKMMELVSPEVADVMYERHMEVLATGQPAEFVKKVKWPDGTTLVFHINIFRVEELGGKRILGGYAVNLTEQQAVEKKLRETHERFLLLSKATSDAIWEWDMQTGQIFRNEALMDLIGYMPVDSKGLSWWLRRIHPEDRDRVADKVKESTDHGKLSWEDEYRFKCADGEYKPIYDKGYIVYENGLPVKMIGSLQDMSNLKKLEDQLTAEKLERQKEISETVIRVQEKERTRIGHELHDNVNQILSTVKLFLDLLKPEGRESQELRDKSVDYLLLAIEEIRKLSKELVVPQLKTASLLESIKALIEDINYTNIVDVRFSHDLESDLLSQGKKVTIFRIVQEQFKNILKYSKAKKVDLLLQRKYNDLILIIKDDGIGFDTKQETKGIGLSNIHDRVRFYNGNVTIESTPGNGCTLTVSIPLSD